MGRLIKCLGSWGFLQLTVMKQSGRFVRRTGALPSGTRSHMRLNGRWGAGRVSARGFFVYVQCMAMAFLGLGVFHKVVIPFLS